MSAPSTEAFLDMARQYCEQPKWERQGTRKSTLFPNLSAQSTAGLATRRVRHPGVH